MWPPCKKIWKADNLPPLPYTAPISPAHKPNEFLDKKRGHYHTALV